MIRDHVWRPTKVSGTEPRHLRRRCAYLNCGRPRADHERAVRGADRMGEP